MDEAAAQRAVVDLLLGPDCLPLKIRAGEFVDESDVARLFDALGVLIAAYRGRTTVPKEIALALVDISAHFDNRFYTEVQQNRLEDIGHELQRLAEELFSTAERR